jgi:Ca2+/Na+ antiporter
MIRTLAGFILLMAMTYCGIAAISLSYLEAEKTNVDYFIMFLVIGILLTVVNPQRGNSMRSISVSEEQDRGDNS